MVGVLPPSACALKTDTAANLAVGLEKTSAKCVDKLNELFCERGVFTKDETGNASGNLTDNLSLTAILSDSKKRLA